MGTYDRQVATALRLIREKGKAVQLKRVTANPQAAMPWRADAPTEALEAVHVVVLPFTQKDAETQGYRLDSEVHKKVRKVLLAGASLSAPPALQDQLVDGAETWDIAYVQELAPNGEQILYTMRVSR